MSSFLVVFGVFIVGFCSAFSSLSDTYDAPLFKDLLEGLEYSYLMATGEFETTGFSGVTWIVFVIGNILNLIILLNLLIAIISNSFARVDENKIRFTYKTRAELIYNYYLSTWMNTKSNPSELLFFALPNERIVSESWLPEKTRTTFI